MRRFYTTALTAALPFLLMRLAWRAKTLPAYRQRWAERFGRYDQAPHAQNKPLDQQSIWIHTVSVGEFLAARPLITALLDQYPQTPLVVTTTTPTGSEQVVKQLGDRVQHVYMPFDLPWMIKRFIRFFNPKIAIFMETELWPNTLQVLKKSDIPAVLINARLSQRSAKSYQRISKTVKTMLQSFEVIIAQDQKDGDRFVQLGLPQSRLKVAGNMKFDMAMPEQIDKKAAMMREKMGVVNRPVLMAASTHEGEEALVLKAFKQIKSQHPDCLLCLVPRHPDRFQKVFELCKDAGWKVAKRSDAANADGDGDIVIGDSMGEMMTYYASVDIAYVGGSLIPIGGHNLIEPAMLAKPIMTGPHLQNFMAIKQALLDHDALMICADENGLAKKVCALLADKERANKMGVHGMEVAELNRGALNRHLKLLQPIIKG
jgi:3-deoxy-D-manno-octulosonic-acid transferase